MKDLVKGREGLLGLSFSSRKHVCLFRLGMWLHPLEPIMNTHENSLVLVSNVYNSMLEVINDDRNQSPE